MMRTFLLIAAFGITSIAHAEVMTCDETKPCSLVCYFPSSSGRTAPVYPDGGGSVDRVIVTTVGDSNLLYIAERRNE